MSESSEYRHPDRRLAPLIIRTCIITAAAAATLAVAGILWWTVDVLLLTFIAILLAILLFGMSDWTAEKLKIPYGLSLGLVLFGLLFAGAVAVRLAAPQVSVQVERLAEDLPKSLQTGYDRLQEYRFMQPLIGSVSPETLQRFSGQWGTVVQAATRVFTSTYTFVVNFFLAILLALLFAMEPELYRRGVLMLVPSDRRPRIAEVMTRLRTTLWSWLIGKLLSMAFVGVATYIGLWILDVPMGLTLSLLAALLGFIPNVGPIIAGIPPVLLALIESPIHALLVLALYIGIQTVQNNVVDPVIDRRTVFLAPALVMVVQIILGVMLGLFGLALAAPLTVVGMVLVRALYIEDVLGERVAEDAETP